MRKLGNRRLVAIITLVLLYEPTQVSGGACQSCLNNGIRSHIASGGSNQIDSQSVESFIGVEVAT